MKKSNGALEARAAQAVTFSMTDEQATLFIATIEKQVADCKNRLQTLEEPKQKALEEFEKLQNQYDAVKAKHDADKRLLDTLSHYKHGLKHNVPLRLERTESHNDMKPREIKKLQKIKVKQFTWGAFAFEVLKEKNRLMTGDELFDAVVIKFDLMQRFEALHIMPNKVKSDAVKNCWTKNATMVMENSKMAESRGKLFKYNDFFGLKEWATPDFKPKPEYSSKAV